MIGTFEFNGISDCKKSKEFLNYNTTLVGFSLWEFLGGMFPLPPFLSICLVAHSLSLLFRILLNPV